MRIEARIGLIMCLLAGPGLAAEVEITDFRAPVGPQVDDVRALYPAPDGSLWVGTRGGGVSHFDGQTWAHFSQDVVKMPGVASIFPGLEGELWFAGRGGAARFANGIHRAGPVGDGDGDGDTNGWSTLAGQLGREVRVAFSGFAEADGSVWLATNVGAAHSDGDTWRWITSESGLLHDVVHDVLRDRAGDLWFATRGGGLSRLNDAGGWEHYLPDRNVRTLLEDHRGGLWAGTDRGVFQRAGSKWTQHYGDGVVLPLFEDSRGDLWFSRGDDGALRYRDGTWTAHTDNLPEGEIHAATETLDGSYWFGTGTGLRRVRKTTRRVGMPPVNANESSSSAAIPGLDLHGALEPGRYGVGFRKETLPLGGDRSTDNLAESELPSAVDLYLWYPAASDGDAPQPMPLADYYRCQEAVEPNRETLRDWLHSDMTDAPGVEPATLDDVLDTPMWSRRDATAADGRHPLVLWSYRDSVPTSQAALNEYLASHGYVVAFAWPTDRLPPFPWQEGVTAEEKVDALAIQVRLLGEVLDRLSERPWIDADPVSLLSWSYGGESAGALQRERPDVGLVVAIDATLASGWVYAPRETIEALEPDLLSAPYVVLRNGRPRIGGDRSAPPPELLAKISAGAWHVRFPELSHGNFNFPGGMIPGVLGLDEVSHWAVGGEVARLGYERVSRSVLAFLEHHRTGDEKALSELFPEEDRVETERYLPHEPP